MPAASSIAIASLVVAAAGTTATVHSGNEARKDARDAGWEAEQKQLKLLDDAKRKQLEEQKALETKTFADQARARQKSQQLQAGGRNGTILTGPLGAPGGAGGTAPASGDKTVLGS